jgi:hypothetical protein
MKVLLLVICLVVINLVFINWKSKARSTKRNRIIIGSFFLMYAVLILIAFYLL